MRRRSARRRGQEAARAVRYDFFHSLIASGQADSILTAHTLNDQAETVLMKFLRGAWTEGLSAIHPIVAVPGPRVGRRRRAPHARRRRAPCHQYRSRFPAAPATRSPSADLPSATWRSPT